MEIFVFVVVGFNFFCSICFGYYIDICVRGFKFFGRLVFYKYVLFELRIIEMIEKGN